jgi:hypothetical protein
MSDSSFNRNPAGKNQHGNLCELIFIEMLVTYNQAGANDETFRAALEKYHREKLTNNEKISRRLLADYDIQMRCTTWLIGYTSTIVEHILNVGNVCAHHHGAFLFASGHRLTKFLDVFCEATVTLQAEGSDKLWTYLIPHPCNGRFSRRRVVIYAIRDESQGRRHPSLHLDA